jgi:3-oxoacyl-[acyl-carrier protein] reductase
MNNQKPLDKKVAIVTGAAQGLGLETALEFARRGAIPVLLDIDSEKLGAALAAARGIESRSLSYVLDVSRKDEWVKTVGDVAGLLGSIDILVNAAAIFSIKPFEEISEDEWDRVFAVNVKGILLGCQAVSPYMRRQKWGRIINFTSQAAKTGGLLIGAHYSASKAAVICMTNTFAHAMAPDNITVNAIAPGIINTDSLKRIPGIENFFARIPLGRMPGEASDVAKAVGFLASDDARYITGETMDVNGGFLMD